MDRLVITGLRYLIGQLPQKSMNKISLENNFVRYISLLFIFGALVLTFPAYDSLAENDSPVSRIKQIAVAEKSGDVFVLNGDGTVAIFDSEKKEFLASPGKTTPRKTDFLAVSPSGEYFAGITVNQFNTSVYVYDTKSYLSSPDGALNTNSFYNLPRKGAGSSALGMFSPGEKVLYVADSLAGKIFVADLTQKKFIEIDTGGIISDLKSDASGKSLFVLIRNPDELAVVDVSTHSITDRYKVGPMASRILYNQTLNRVYVSERGSDSINAIDLNSKKMRRVSVGKSPVSMTYDKASGNVFVGSNADGVIYNISPDFTIKKVALGTPAYASYPIDLWYSQKARKLLALNQSVRKLYFIDPIEFRIEKEENINGWARGIAGGENSSLSVIFRANSNDILLANSKENNVSYFPQTSEKPSKVFSSPQGVVVDIRSHKIYVGNLSSGEITVIDGKTLEFIAKIPVGIAPYVLYLNENLKKLYVSDSVSNTVTVIDISRSDFPTKIIPAEGMPRTVSGNNLTNMIYVSLAKTKKVRVIDGANDTMIKEIQLDAKSVFPAFLTVNDKKNEVYVADYGANFISVLDGTKNTVKKTIIVGNKPIWIAYIPAIDRIYVAVEGDKKIVVIDSNSYEILNTFQINASPYRIVFDYKTNFAYVTHRNEKVVTVIKNDESGARVLKEIEMPFLGQLDAIPYNMIYADTRRFDENTKKAYLTSQRLNNVTVASVERDAEGIIQLLHYAEINEDGKVSLSGIRKETTSSGLPRWQIILIIILISTGVIAFISKRKSGSIKPLGGV